MVGGGRREEGDGRSAGSARSQGEGRVEVEEVEEGGEDKGAGKVAKQEGGEEQRKYVESHENSEGGLWGVMLQLGFLKVGFL